MGQLRVKARQVEVRYSDKPSRGVGDSCGCSLVQGQCYARLHLNLTVNLVAKSVSLFPGYRWGQRAFAVICPGSWQGWERCQWLRTQRFFAASWAVPGREWIGTTPSGGTFWPGWLLQGMGWGKASLFSRPHSCLRPPCPALSSLGPPTACLPFGPHFAG